MPHIAHRYDPTGYVLVAGTSAWAAAVASASASGAVGAGIGFKNLTPFHAWRVPAAFVFFYYGLRDELPAVSTPPVPSYSIDDPRSRDQHHDFMTQRTRSLPSDDAARKPEGATA